MAYDPAIPALENYIGDDIPKIMANFAELAGSRIVEHNLDVANPPNGWYVRWDNGLQICSVRIEVGEYTSTRTQQGITVYRWNTTWTFPAVFLQGPRVSGACSLGAARLLETVALGESRGTPSNFRIYVNQIAEFTSGYVDLIAVGRWK